MQGDPVWTHTHTHGPLKETCNHHALTNEHIHAQTHKLILAKGKTHGRKESKKEHAIIMCTHTRTHGGHTCTNIQVCHDPQIGII